VVEKTNLNLDSPLTLRKFFIFLLLSSWAKSRIEVYNPVLRQPSRSTRSRNAKMSG